MPHQCIKCSKIIPIGSKELITGCSECGGRFFFYIKDELLAKAREKPNPIIEITSQEKLNIEKDIREIAGIKNEEVPVILDIESVRVLGEGKFEIDIVNLFNKKRPLIYRIEEGKYIIDLPGTFSKNIKDLKNLKKDVEKDKINFEKNLNEKSSD